MKFLPSKLINYTLIIILVGGMYSCRKDLTIKIVNIQGPRTVCYGDTGIIYSVDANPGAYILWTVPEQAEIASGQGTNLIKLNFGRKAGKICVKYYSEGEEISVDSCLEVNFDVSDKWCRELDFKGGPRNGSVGFSIGDKGYIATGSKVSDYYNDFWEFDPALKTWTQKAPFPGGKRAAAVGFSINTKGYIGTGHSETGLYFRDFWEYNPVSNQWLRKADCSNTSRIHAFGFSIGNKGYIGTGLTDGSELLNDFWEYDPTTDAWVKKADILPRIRAVGFSIGNKGYFGTGGAEGAVEKKDLWEFDPSDASDGLDVNNNPIGKWTIKADLPGPARAGSVAFSIENKGYILMGDADQSSTLYNDFYEYDPNLNLWNTLPSGGFAGEFRQNAIGFSIGKKGYVGTGYYREGLIDRNLTDFWVYTK